MIKNNYAKIQSTKTLFTFAILILTSACQTLDTKKNWPDDIPKRSIYVKDYLTKKNLSSVDPRVLDDHLIWVIRFYHGTLIYPNGWNRISEMFLDSVDDPRTQKKLTRKIKVLGIKIVNEWAQDNGVRNINSANIAVWASALKTSADRDDQISFIDKVDSDVNQLIARTLSPNEISYERYYSEQDFDDF